jgi:hypothetical protein
MKESKRSKTFEHTTKNKQYDDSHNQMKKKPKPDTRKGMMDHQFQGLENL